ncbi:TetR family transcriptional regulator [Actinomycetospora sp. CA-101289]|uniref:TetR family transcriptional regulator n=1 Tax=Actinomycetospora sp. CA-101289 TaxID=3239893 RepID=UPI003D9521AF
MSTAYETHGRRAQKRRTREALTAAARELIATGDTPTVEAAAAAAAVSRTTAYRYFPNQHALLAAAHPETVATSLLPPEPPDDPAQRLGMVVAAFTRIVLDTEAQQRTMLRLSLEADPPEHTDLPLRQGRAIGWIEEALAPLHGQLPEKTVHQLVLAIRSATGVEALVWLTDVAGLAREDAIELMAWTAQALLRAAMTGFPPAGARP